MADESNPKSPKPSGDKPEMSMEKRMLIAFGLMGLVLFGTQFFMPKAPKPAADKTPAPVASQSAPATPQPAAPKPAQPSPAVPSPAGQTKAAAAPAAAPAVSAAKEELLTVETDVYRIVFSNKGAVVRSWVLKKYKDGSGQPVELASASAAPKAGWPFAFVFPREKPGVELNGVLFSASQPDPLTVEFTYGDGKVSARKSFRFEAKGYRSDLRSEVTKEGRGVDHQLSWRGGFGDRTVHKESDNQKSVYYDGSRQKLVEEGKGFADKGPMTVAGPYHFAGIEDTFFAGVVLPKAGSPIEFVTWSDVLRTTKDGEETAHVGVSFGGGAVIDAGLFIGPKDTDILRATDRKLETMIDWGWFWFIAKPLFLSLHWVDENITHNWGWAIVLATVVINLLMLPLRFSQLKSSQKMAVIQPELQAIQAKYKGMSMKDPRKQKQNEEMMALYQKHGINPMGGCVPLLLQMPFFIAFFKVLSVAIELRGAQWLWVTDLSQPETLPIRLLPVGMLVSQVLMQKMTPAASPDPAQQRLMMIMMPVMLTVMFYGASSGLVLYWLTGNVVGIAQQFFFNKAVATPAPAQPTAKKK
ncbi:MAG: membrane protein insertase YidC [Acidobacteria bacterium]|nr:membrane protein insertase YidC [Acidobacteriota bacterium]